MVADVEKKRSGVTIYVIPEYTLLQAKNTEVNIYNAENQRQCLGRKKRQRYTTKRLFKQKELEKRRGGKGNR